MKTLGVLALMFDEALINDTESSYYHNPLHVKPTRTHDELERGIDLVPQPLADGNAPNPAEEAIVIFESQGSASRP